MRRRQKGFSLIELLIVVAIILIIAAIAIPNLLRSKMAANEASAVGSLRTINTACIEYSTTYGGYPSALTNLGPAAPATPLPTSLAHRMPTATFWPTRSRRTPPIAAQQVSAASSPTRPASSAPMPPPRLPRPAHPSASSAILGRAVNLHQREPWGLPFFCG